MSIADQIKDLEKQKEEIEHRIAQLSKVGATPEPTITEGIKELEKYLEVIERQIEKDTEAVIRLEKNREGVLREREEVKHRIVQLQSLRYQGLFGYPSIDF